jgi:hypothetical protein
MAKLPTKEEIEAAQKALEPYLLALGKVAHAWNLMQEQLGVLFCTVSSLETKMGMNIWHALKSDRSQRDLLDAAISATDDDWNQEFPKAKDDIMWILKKVGQLSEGRNSAIHAPMFSLIGGEPEIRPMTIFQNPHAAKLLDKDLLAEFEWYEKYFDSLRVFAGTAHVALLMKPASWPDRPLLPTVKQKSGRRDHSHQSNPK